MECIYSNALQEPNSTTSKPRSLNQFSSIFDGFWDNHFLERSGQKDIATSFALRRKLLCFYSFCFWPFLDRLMRLCISIRIILFHRIAMIQQSVFSFVNWIIFRQWYINLMWTACRFKYELIIFEWQHTTIQEREVPNFGFNNEYYVNVLVFGWSLVFIMRIIYKF